MSARRSSPLSAVGSLLAALRLLRRRRELWIWCLLPVLVNVAMFTLAIALFLARLDELVALLQGLLGTAEPEVWYEWLWVGPLRGIAWALTWILLAILGVATYVLFTLLGGIIAAPFLEILSRHVERIRTGRVDEQAQGFVPGALRAMREESKRVLFFAAGQLVFLLLGFLPGLQPLAAAGALGFTVLFLPLDYTGYVMDRRALSFGERRTWIWRHKGGMLGFGGVAFASFFVPGLNFLCLPWLVTAGTLLVLDTEQAPPEPAQAG